VLPGRPTPREIGAFEKYSRRGFTFAPFDPDLEEQGCTRRLGDRHCLADLFGPDGVRSGGELPFRGAPFAVCDGGVRFLRAKGADVAGMASGGAT
jgi:hypothetical protein